MTKRSTKWNVDNDTYVASVCLAPESDGTYSAYVTDLPGCVSCGNTKSEAVNNIKDAFVGCIAAYRADGEEIPWGPTAMSKRQAGCEYVHVVVNIPSESSLDGSHFFQAHAMVCCPFCDGDVIDRIKTSEAPQWRMEHWRCFECGQRWRLRYNIAEVIFKDSNNTRNILPITKEDCCSC